MKTWAIITGEYPPQTGGVGDYTRLVARGLAAKGDEVHVWAPRHAKAYLSDEGVAVHRLPGHFGPRAMFKLESDLRRLRQPYRLLVQYTPHAYGLKALNLPFCAWISMNHRAGMWVMFHEVVFPLWFSIPDESARIWHKSLGHRIQGVVTRAMASLMARSAERTFVSIPAYDEILRSLTPGQERIEWLPVPSNIPPVEDSSVAVEFRKTLTSDSHRIVVGHFGTFGPLITPVLHDCLPQILFAHPRCIALLIGNGSERFAHAMISRHSDLQGRILATGALPAEEISRRIGACDLMLQPYPDGASSRRGSLMASIAAGRATVSNHGPFTEKLWRQSGAVALADSVAPDDIIAAATALLVDESGRQRVAAKALALYRDRFAIDHTLNALCS